MSIEGMQKGAQSFHGETQMKFMEQEKGNTHEKRRETTAP
jgi:hypothetical protein